ncbi:MAG: recombinase family protein [Candidatus Latescibacteria bacterium]|nr:recombinase family protein [Candidatus Latescibacterota bacterium]
MKIGYARVSTEDQQLTVQLEQLDKAGCKKIFREKLSGAQRQRPELNRLLEHLREGDTVVVWKLDRLARSTRDLLEIVARRPLRSVNDASARGQAWADRPSCLEPTPAQAVSGTSLPRPRGRSSRDLRLSGQSGSVRRRGRSLRPSADVRGADWVD